MSVPVCPLVDASCGLCALTDELKRRPAEPASEPEQVAPQSQIVPQYNPPERAVASSVC